MADSREEQGNPKHMKDQEEPHVVSADRLDGSIIITFNDGRCAIYSSALLYATLPQAEELYDLVLDNEQGAVKGHEG